MKKITFISVFLGMTLIIFSCKQYDTDFEKIHIKDIKSATIAKHPHYITGDSIRSIPFEYIDKFATVWNNPMKIELTKCMAQFKIDIVLKNDSVRSFYLNSNIIKERTDFFHYSKDSTLGARLWELSYKY